MTKFDLDRFGKVMSRLLVISQRKRSVIFITFLIIFLVLAKFTTPMFSGKSMDDIGYKSFVSEVVDFIGIFSPIVFFVLGTFFIQDLEGRQQRINELMLPATNLEKFVARVLLVAVIYPLAICASFIVADGLQQLISMIIAHGERMSMVVAYFDADTYVKCRLTPMDQGFVDTFELFNCYLWRFTLSQVSLAEVDSCLFYCDYSFSYRLFLLKVVPLRIH